MSTTPTMFLHLRDRSLKQEALSRLQRDFGSEFRVFGIDGECSEFCSGTPPSGEELPSANSDYLAAVYEDDTGSDEGVLMSNVRADINDICRQAAWMRSYLAVMAANREAWIVLSPGCASKSEACTDERLSRAANAGLETCSPGNGYWLRGIVGGTSLRGIGNQG